MYENLPVEAQNLLIEKDFRITKLETELAQIKRMIFGTKSERFVPEIVPGQTTLDFNLEQIIAAEKEKETLTYTREKKKSGKIHIGRLPIPASIERVKIEIEPTEQTTGLIPIRYLY